MYNIHQSTLYTVYTAEEEGSHSTDLKRDPTDFIQLYFDELFDLVESPMFNVAFTEACDTCFRRHMDTLREDVFMPLSLPSVHSATYGTGAGGGGVRAGTFSTPPLASILPQLKSLSSKLLPSDGRVSYEVKEITCGSAVEAMCLSILNISPTAVAGPEEA